MKKTPPPNDYELKEIAKRFGTHRNEVRQVVPIFDENKKQIGTNVVFHNKKFNQPQYADKKKFWDMLNTTARNKN